MRHPSSLFTRACLRSLTFVVGAGCALALPSLCAAQNTFGSESAAAREQRRQEERVNDIRQKQERSADVRRTGLPAAPADRLPTSETPCFRIDAINLQGDEDGRFAWLDRAAAGPQGDDSPAGRCLGEEGINLVLRRLQNALITRGYVTSSVGAVPQDLNSGSLTLLLTVGRIAAIRYEPDDGTGPSLAATLPATPGDVLNLRDIEQGYENLKRVPTADSEIKIVPSGQTGFSDLVISRKAGSPLRGALTLDDGGMRSTGRYQGNLTLAWDNPAGMSDLAYLSLSHDLGISSHGRGTRGAIAHYSVPYGYWHASATVDHSRNHRTVAGATQDYEYSGRHDNAELRLSRLVHRDGSGKTTLSAGLFRRESKSFIEDTEVLVQRRHAGGWFAAVDHRHYFGDILVDANLTFKRGTGAFGAISAPEEAFGEGTARYQILTANLAYAIPFTAAERRWTYAGELRAQRENTRLAPPEQFAIGGRYTVRGFDGETILAAERGFLLRNELATPLSAFGHSFDAYAGLDYGAVSGPSADLLVGKRLAGAVIGVRGQVKGVRYDVFAGTPLYKPDGFDAPDLTAGFELRYSF